VNLQNAIYTDAKAAREHLEAIRWPDGPVCPHCGVQDKASRVAGGRDGLLFCNGCRKQYSVTVGTVYERSHIPLNKWVLATHLMCASKKGMSANQLRRMLGLTYKSAWFMAHRIRAATAEGNPGPLGGEGKTIEADETYFGNKAGTKRARKTGGRIGPREVESRLPCRARRQVPLTPCRFSHRDTVRNVVVTNASRKSDLMTDESNVYTNLGAEFASHGTVKHSEEEYVRGNIHTNTVEGFFSIFKRGMKGIYQHCGEAHLHRYLAEFDFRYSYRIKLGYSDVDSVEIALKGIEGKRLTYRPIG
jgi:transposase-like protein